MMIMGLSICSSPYTPRCNLLACLRQTLMVILINIPTVSFGLAMGWVSLATGKSVQVAVAAVSPDVEADATLVGGGPGWQMITAATITFCASLAGMPLCARVLAAGRKPAIIVTSVLFMLCWALKLYGDGWWVVAARACAGVAGAGAWILSPLVAREMCSGNVRGAAVSALVLANNLGMLLMYLAALLHVQHTTVLWSCFCLSLAHCMVFVFVPESPQYLAAHGHMDIARDSLAWLRGVPRDDPSLSIELAEFVTNETQNHDMPAIKLIKDMMSERGRRSAFLLSCVMVLGQEVSGVLALLQYAERVFLVASGGARNEPGDQSSHLNHSEQLSQYTELEQPATHAVLLGTAQLIASAFALYLIEKVGRKRLMVCCGAVTGLSLAGCALAVRCGVGSKGGAGIWAPILLAVAVFADSAGLEPAPYAMVADMFDYQYRSCALMLLDALTWLGNAVETLLFPVLVTQAGLSTTLALCAVLTLSVTAYVLWRAPETKGRTTQQIYDEILKRTDHAATDNVTTKL